MFKNNIISKEFCQQMTKKDVIIHQKVRASEASEETKWEKRHIFGILRLFWATKLSQNEDTLLRSGKI